MLFAVLSVTACKPDNPTPDPDPTPTPDPDPNPDPNPDPDPDPDPAVYTVSFSVGDGSAVAEQQVEENGYATRPTEDPVLAGHDFGGWYKDSECTVEFDFAAEKIVADTTIYAKWTEKAPQYENVSYSLNISDLSAETLAEDSINGMFTINAGTEIRNRNKTWKNPEDSTDTKSFQRSAKLGGDANTITVSVPGTGKLAFYIQNGSSGADYQKVKITAPDGTVSEIEFVGKIESSPVVRLEIDVTEGEWKINRVSGTIDIFLLELECSVLVSEEIGFELAATGSTAFLVGESLDTSGIRANAVFESGKTEPIAMKDLVIDSSAVDMTRRGVYTVHVQYKDYEKLSFEVTVFEPARLVLHTDAIEKIENSSYGNGVYFNFSFKEVYKLGESFSKKGLSVEVIAEAAEGATRSFVVDEYEVLGFDSSTAGAVTLTVKYTYAEGKSVTGTIDISVVPGEPVAADGVYTVRVDGAYDGAIGAVVDGKARFTTVQQALDFLAGAEATAKKVIELAGGKYNEKLEITIPNLTVRADEGAEAVIEWDSLFGLPDGSGFTHVTDSTATVSVRESAYNLTLENVTISNYWNSQAIFDAELGAGYSEHRALALLVQADRFTMKGGSLLGYQDTVQFFTGRQLFEGVFIQGVTDFIFGSNNTTLFKSCTIHSISNGKTDGGYITAFKGNNKGTDDVVTYGAIFYQCSFTADADVVTNGNTAIGRPWGAYAAVAVIECELDGHISTKGFSGSSKNERYVSMNAKPTDSTVQFVEFGNTGAGAITEAVAGMRFLTAEEVANYYDYAVIFGRNNGKVSYLDPWDPTSDEVKADERTYYYFDQGSSPTGTSHTYDIETPSFKGSTLSFGELVISAENGNVAWNKNANALNMKQGAFITFSIKAGTEITVNTYPGYSFLTVNGVGTSSATFVRYFDTDTEVVIMSVGDLYLYSIIVNPAAEAPEAPTLDEIKVEGFNTNYTVGDELALEGVTVKAYYSDNSVHTVTDFEVNTDAVVNTAAGEYEVVFSFGGKSVTVTVAYEDPDRDPAITENTVLSFVTEDDYNAVISNIRVTTEGNFRKNGSEYQIQGTISFLVKAGTIVKVNPYANTQ